MTTEREIDTLSPAEIDTICESFPDPRARELLTELVESHKEMARATAERRLVGSRIFHATPEQRAARAAEGKAHDRAYRALTMVAAYPLDLLGAAAAMLEGSYFETPPKLPPIWLAVRCVRQEAAVKALLKVAGDEVLGSFESGSREIAVVFTHHHEGMVMAAPLEAAEQAASFARRPNGPADWRYSFNPIVCSELARKLLREGGRVLVDHLGRPVLPWAEIDKTLAA